MGEFEEHLVRLLSEDSRGGIVEPFSFLPLEKRSFIATAPSERGDIIGTVILRL